LTFNLLTFFHFLFLAPISNQSQISLNQALPVQKTSSFAMPQHHVTTSISSNNFEQLKKLSDYADTVDAGPIYYSGQDEV
jgi:hypothetical protein